jgi:hypothetical protein
MKKPILLVALVPVVMFAQSVAWFWPLVFLMVAWATSRPDRPGAKLLGGA